MNNILNILKREKENKIKGGLYHKIQVMLTYNSNHIEGSKLTGEQTRQIFETNTILADTNNIDVDDILETVNHFRCIDYMIDNAQAELTSDFIKQLHRILKTNTSQSGLEWFKVGDWKILPNEVGGEETVEPEQTENEINKLISHYNNLKEKSFEDILDFHVSFEKIHPFQDGNGRVGRLVMFKQCLENNTVPFIIDEEHKLYYYRGLQQWNNIKGYLTDTCLSCQDVFKTYLDYFKIDYTDAKSE
ncbi:MAG: Fic family protein [Bacteroidales bacterium]|nr:Fic family protein [Bacteroidales bacterium]